MSEPLPLTYWFESKPSPLPSENWLETVKFISEPLPLTYCFESKPLPLPSENWLETVTLMPEFKVNVNVKVNVKVSKSKSKSKMSNANTLLLPKRRKQSEETKLRGDRLEALCGERIPTFRGYYPKILYGPSVDYRMMYRSDSFKQQESIRYKATLTKQS